MKLYERSRDHLVRLIASDEETEGHPVLPDGSREQIQDALEVVLRNPDAWALHEQLLSEQLSTERHQWVLTFEEHDRVLAEGLCVLSDSRLAGLALNRIGLAWLARTIDEAFCYSFTEGKTDQIPEFWIESVIRHSASLCEDEGPEQSIRFGRLVDAAVEKAQPPVLSETAVLKEVEGRILTGQTGYSPGSSVTSSMLRDVAPSLSLTQCASVLRQLGQAGLLYKPTVSSNGELAVHAEGNGDVVYCVPQFDHSGQAAWRWAYFQRYHDEIVFACLLALLPDEEKHRAMEDLHRKFDAFAAAAREPSKDYVKIARCLREIPLAICYHGAPDHQTRFLAVKNAERAFNWLASGQPSGALAAHLDSLVAAEELRLKALRMEVQRDDVRRSDLEHVFSAYRRRLADEFVVAWAHWERKSLPIQAEQDFVQEIESSAWNEIKRLILRKAWDPVRDRDELIILPLAQEVVQRVLGEAGAVADASACEDAHGKGPTLALVLRVSLERWAGREIIARLYCDRDERFEVISQLSPFLDRMKEIAASESADRIVEFVLLDVMFHITILRMAGADWQAAFLAQLYRQVNLRTTITVRFSDRRIEICEDHRELVDLLIEGDAKAFGEKCEEHITGGLNKYDPETFRSLQTNVPPVRDGFSAELNMTFRNWELMASGRSGPEQAKTAERGGRPKDDAEWRLDVGPAIDLCRTGADFAGWRASLMQADWYGDR